MDKWTLKNKITDYQDKILEDRNEITRLEDRIGRLTTQKTKLNEMIGETEQFYSTKRTKCEGLREIARGKTSLNVIIEGLDIYSVAQESKYKGYFDEIISCVNHNIEKLKEMIANLEADIHRCNAAIDDCNSQIADIERKEREDREREERERKEKINAGFSSK